MSKCIYLHAFITEGSDKLTHQILTDLGVNSTFFSKQESENISSFSPIDGKRIGQVAVSTQEEIEQAISSMYEAAKLWGQVPAPKRGELIRGFGDILRVHKDKLACLISLEVGKIYQEALGEVQEMIDICDFAVGLSRQLYGLTIASERPGHRMMETWHPLGAIGLITPFNFPAAVWAWNMTLAVVCGNTAIWKPSEKAPLTALACQKLFELACQKFTQDPLALSIIIQGGRPVCQQLIDDSRLPLISATGGTEMGREVGQRVARRFGRSLLELGGNNAMIVTPSADMEMALRSILFSAVGTTGQRCTTLRRLFVHQSIYASLKSKLQQLYPTIRIGNPLDEQTLCGPLIDERSFQHFEESLQQAIAQGGSVTGGKRILQDQYPTAYYVEPALVEIPSQTAVVKHETFGPILYMMPYTYLKEAIDLNNEVGAGLSSCIFTRDIREAETFMGASDCGITNVNIGPSGAEIGGAFGGEKETGGGRESGTDSWRNYMRRATNTINYSTHLPLAQGIKFDI